MNGFEDFVDHLQAHAGDTLQAVVVYRGDEHRDRYRRDDVVELHGSVLEAAVLADIRSDQRRLASGAADRYEGDHRVSDRLGAQPTARSAYVWTETACSRSSSGIPGPSSSGPELRTRLLVAGACRRCSQPNLVTHVGT